MSNIGFLISVWEYDLLRKKAFWRKLGRLIHERKIDLVGFSLLSPYGLTYNSKLFKKYVASDDFTDLFLKGLLEINADESEVRVGLWCSLLYNTFLPTKLRQVNSKGTESSDLICPNKLGIYETIEAIFEDVFSQPWLAQLRDAATCDFILDGIHFADIDYCFCEECAQNSREELKMDFGREFLHTPMLQRFIYRWTGFRSRSIARFMQKVTHLLKRHSCNVDAIYSGFSGPESTIVSGPIRNGCVLDDFLKSETDRIFIRGNEDWLSDPRTLSDLKLAVPFWRDMLSIEKEEFGLAFYGRVLEREIASISKLSGETAIDRVVFAPMSLTGVEAALNCLSTKELLS